MLDDAYPDARYNAAVALAHHGRAKAVATLVEMLDPSANASDQKAESDQVRAANRTMTATGALAAAEDLAQQSRDADLSPVVQAIKNLILNGTNVDPHIVTSAKHTLAVLEQQSPPK